ncbi:BON domain-containing protein [Bradyrhizobium sp. WD16]|uniref:BON domain-containing protein n=1 Tax=Bradyrhizobium sp. WD16 TaxID=1521768 RepID=UPI0020A32EBE|nr:BON domain-containing protein [Bradyrhizobium sp. WD16]UTD25748.1 ornithine aminotransferase [Bradyrhizobium sp. WD16]
MNELQLRDDVLDELAYEPVVDAARVGVSVDRNVVTLTGRVTSYAQKLAAVAAVRRVRGVQAIADEIEVAGAGDETTSDAEIARRAAEVLSWDSAIPAGAVQVTVRDGRVTLTGEVEWHYQRAGAEQDVRNLAGVRSVSNDITIMLRPNVADIKRMIETALRRHADIEAQNVRVTVTGNTVELDGIVNSWSEKAAIETAAWSAAGVATVKDRIAIAPQ